jgi:tetratricopeptide (TPR) repeat protein
MAEGQHLEEGQLAEFAAGSMSNEEAKEIARHLAACAHCTARHEQLAADLFSKTLAAPISKNSPPPTRPDAPSAHESYDPTLAQTGLRKGATLGGRYVLIERLGAGGMGEVFSAYDPKLDRRLALKLLRPGTLSAEEGRVRLEREAQSMARLSHPNVVTVFDVGHWEDRVFVAMEFVEGETLSNWLRGDHTWQEIVLTFIQAGSGLAAAHSAGIVHRDFKPDNVLIGKDGRPKVMDFGLARQSTSSNPSPIAAAGMAHDKEVEFSLNSPITRDGAVMGTPGYMAPEQLSGLATDARSDQFSFSVALFEALYGRRPFGGNTLRTHRDEILAGKLSPLPSGSTVPGWVHDAVKRGLSAEPDARWPAMDQLLEALRPKRAQNRRRMIGAFVALSVLALAALSIAVQGQRRLRQCAGFDVRLQHVWDEPTRNQLRNAFMAARAPYAADSWKTVEAALNSWTREWVNISTETCELGKVKQVDSPEVHQLKLLCLEDRLDQLKATENLLESADTEVITNSVVMVRGLKEVDECRDVAALLRKQHPHDEAGHEKEKPLTTALFEARALHDAGKYAKGIEVMSKALAAAEGAPPGPLAEARLLLARLQDRMSEVKQEYATLDQALLDAERSGEASLVARAYSRQAMVVGSLQHKFDDAHRLEALAQAAGSRVAEDREVEAELSSNSGLIALEEARWEQAKDAFQNALTLQEQALGPDNPEVARTLNNLGMALAQLGKFKEAVEVYERSRDIHVRNQGEMHPDTANSLSNLAAIYRREGRLSEAYNALDEALKARQAAFGDDNPQIASSYLSLAKLLVRMGKLDEALADYDKALAIRLKKFGPEDPQVAAVYDDLAQFYLKRGFGKEALEKAQLAYDIDAKSLGADHVTTTHALDKIGRSYEMLGQWQKAENALNQSLEARKAKRGLESAEVAQSYRLFGELYLAQGKASNAIQFYQRALDIRTKTDSTNDQAIAGELTGLGRCYLALGEAPKAVAPLEKAVALREKGEDEAELATARFLYARALYDAEPDQKAKALELAAATKDDLPQDEKDALQNWLKTHPSP